MYASRIFHSRGIVQSKTAVPVGTSGTSNGMCDPISLNVCRTPFHVMLRQMGNILAANAKISSPMSSVRSCRQRQLAIFMKSLEPVLTPAQESPERADDWRCFTVAPGPRVPQISIKYFVGIGFLMGWYRGPSKPSNHSQAAG